MRGRRVEDNDQKHTHIYTPGMMESNAVQSDLVVVEYQPFYGRNVVIALALDLSYAIVRHV